MTPLERGIMEKAADGLPGTFDEVVEPLNGLAALTDDGDALTPAGELFVLGYCAGVLATVRDTHVQPEPITAQDCSEIRGILRGREDTIAASLEP